MLGFSLFFEIFGPEVVTSYVHLVSAKLGNEEKKQSLVSHKNNVLKFKKNVIFKTFRLNIKCRVSWVGRLCSVIKQ